MAKVVVIVGYRMPDSDGNAMAMISDGLRSGKARGVHLVLGPNVDGKEMPRLRGYLENIVGEKRLKVWPAYAPGFFSTLRDREPLLNPTGAVPVRSLRVDNL